MLVVTRLLPLYTITAICRKSFVNELDNKENRSNIFLFIENNILIFPTPDIINVRKKVRKTILDV